MSSREIILQRIRSGLANAAAAGFADVREPPVPEVWPQSGTAPAALVARFREELQLLNGEPIHCGTLADAQSATLQTHADRRTVPFGHALGCLDRPLVRDLTVSIAPDRLDWVSPDWTAERIEQLPVGLITAEALLADTGSCVVRCMTATERLMCYLPPACIVVARVEQLPSTCRPPGRRSPRSATCPRPAARSCSSPVPAARRTSRRS